MSKKVENVNEDLFFYNTYIRKYFLLNLESLSLIYLSQTYNKLFVANVYQLLICRKHIKSHSLSTVTNLVQFTTPEGTF